MSTWDQTLARRGHKRILPFKARGVIVKIARYVVWKYLLNSANFVRLSAGERASIGHIHIDY